MSRRQKPPGQSTPVDGGVGEGARLGEAARPRAVAFEDAAAVGDEPAVLGAGAGVEDRDAAGRRAAARPIGSPRA